MFWLRFKLLCETGNKSPNAVCKDIGVSNAIATKWKKGSYPNSSIIIDIAQYFNVSTDYLLGLTDDASPVKQTSDTLSGSEREMLSGYRQLDNDDQAEVRGYIKGMLTKDKYKKYNEEAIG